MNGHFCWADALHTFVSRNITPVLSAPGRLLALALAGVLFSGCASSPAFRANFDADDVGAPPNPNPPGAPAGDRITSSTNRLGVFRVVEDPVLRSRSLRIGNVGPSQWIGFVPVAVSPTAETVFAYWRGVMKGAHLISPFDIWLGDGRDTRIGAIRFEGGNLLVQTTTGYDIMGSYTPDVTHVIIFTFNRTARTFGVSFLQGPTPLSRHGLSLLSPGVGGATRPSLFMGFDFAGGGFTEEYIADDIVISEREPDI